MMPKMDGMTVLRRLREQGNPIPVLMLTARSEVSDKVLGLDSGANDYLTKPFSTKELMARIRAITRSQSGQITSRLTLGNITLDQATFELSSPAGSFRLANREYQMMELLMRGHGRPISAEEMACRVWGMDRGVSQDVVWVHISSLRRKLRQIRASAHIGTYRGQGYVLEE